jgi:hypothetical protein
MHTHTIRDDGSWRWSISAGENLDWRLRFEVARRWRFGLIATCGYGGQEDFLEGTLALPRLLFLHVGIDTPFKLHRLRPRDGKQDFKRWYHAKDRAANPPERNDYDERGMRKA